MSPHTRQAAKVKPLLQTRIAPSEIRMTDDGGLFVAFERAAFGTLCVPLPRGHTRHSLTVHLGEKLNADGRIDRKPPGTIRYRRIEQTIEPGQTLCRLIIPSDERNTGPAAIKMPAEVGEVLPFRYAEIESGADIPAEGICQIAVHYP
ncbi:MAG: alpha-L-rhamnosidase, partial [Lentisphaeria bacterium]